MSSSSTTSSSNSSDIEELQFLRLEEDKEINILLLGETGVGKSTFINALGNYLSLKYFSNAEQKGLVKVIPTVYQIQDKNGKLHKIKLKPHKDENEKLEIGQSATQNVKTYVFPIAHGHVNVRLIDTPGMGDTRGVTQDEINGANIINYIKTLEKIHAICFLCKPTQVRKTIYFDYCVYQVLSLVEKSAVKNMCFLFSHTRGSNYQPGDTLVVLKKILQNVEDDTGIKIPVDEHKNIFCFDNEAFRYLGACEKKIQFDPSVRERYRESWMYSARECWRFIKYLQRDIKPYTPDKLVELHFARKTMIEFSEVLAEITKITDNNGRLLERLEENKNMELQSISHLKTQKTVVTDVEKSVMNMPMLVCSSQPSCAELYKVKGEDKWHYKRICHSCYEIDNYTLNIAGCPDIVNCDVIDKRSRRCTRCGCDFLLHMHINYITTLKENSVSHDDIYDRIAQAESIALGYGETADEIKLKNVEMLSEHEIIKKFCMNVARFIRNNAIIAFSESYRKYIIYLINQKQSPEASSISVSIEELKKYSQQYAEVEIIYKEALKTPISSRDDLKFNMQSVQFDDLCNTLTDNGHKIRDLYGTIRQSLSNLNSVKEYVHDTYFEKEPKDRNRNNRGNEVHRRNNRTPRPGSRNNYREASSRGRGNSRGASNQNFRGQQNYNSTNPPLNNDFYNVDRNQAGYGASHFPYNNPAPNNAYNQYGGNPAWQYPPEQNRGYNAYNHPYSSYSQHQGHSSRRQEYPVNQRQNSLSQDSNIDRERFNKNNTGSNNTRRHFDQKPRSSAGKRQCSRNRRHNSQQRKRSSSDSE